MEQLRTYQGILATTGVQWGLIGPREADRLWERHIDNCLAVTEDADCLPRAASVIDVGSGAGLPGLVWAIAREDLSVTLLEPLARRARFLDLVVEQLQLPNVVVVRGRAQDFEGRADRVAARAVARTDKLVKWLAPLVGPGGKMVLLKGEQADQEVAEARPWLAQNRWRAQTRTVGAPARTRVVVVERTTKG